MQIKTILVATRPELLPVAHRIYIAPEFKLIFCSTLNEAVAALDSKVDLIVCGVHFGEGEVYDFLRLAKANPHAKDIPFFVMDSGAEALSPYVNQSVEIASKALGATAVVPITKWRRQLGDEEAFEAYRQLIRKTLGE